MNSILLIGPGEHFGGHIARRFAAGGYAIGLISKTPEHLSRLTHDLQSEGVTCVSHVADVTDRASFSHAVTFLQQQLGNFSCVIFNVKQTVSGSVLTIDTDLFAECLKVNVVGAVLAMQVVLPYMDRSGKPSFILTGGGYKDTPDPTKLALSASKAAQHNVMLAMIQPLAEQGVAVKTVVIDGAVNEEGAIRAVDVAEIFWHAHTSPDESIFTIKQ